MINKESSCFSFKTLSKITVPRDVKIHYHIQIVDISDSYPIESWNHFGQIQANLVAKKSYRQPGQPKETTTCVSGQIMATGLLQMAV